MATFKPASWLVLCSVVILTGCTVPPEVAKLMDSVPLQEGVAEFANTEEMIQLNARSKLKQQPPPL